VTRIRISGAYFPRPDGVPEGSIVSLFRVPAEIAGQRLDTFVQSQLKRTSRTRTQKIIKLSAYNAKGDRVRANDRVREGQEIFLWRPPWDETEVPTSIPVLYEDEYFLAVNKPANLPVHPSARYHRNTLIMMLQAARPNEFVSLAHRIDRETSGVLLVSKTRACDRALKRMFQRRDGVHKQYTAITWGVPDPNNGATTFRVEYPLERDYGSRFQVKMRVGRSEESLHAATQFYVEDHVVASTGRTYARIRCILETGRQHQIRVHLATVGTPIVGDKLYGPDEELFARSADGDLTEEDLRQLELPRHALHASRIAFTHPITNDPITIDAPLPEDLDRFWQIKSLSY
jgi:23S rRNA pseudouridine1911/1915/1917 synthase